MGSTKAQPSFRTGWARPRIHSGVMLAMLEFNTITTRAWSVRAAPSTVRTASLQTSRPSFELSILAGRSCMTRMPSATGSTRPTCSSGRAASTWRMAALSPARWVVMASWTIPTAAWSLAPSPTVGRPIARSTASTRSGATLTTVGEASILSTIASLGQHGEQRQIVAQMPRDEKVATDVLPSGRAHAADQLRIAEEMPDAEGRALHRLHRVAGDARKDLVGYPPSEAAHHGLALPHGRGHVDPEAGADRLVDDDGGCPLEGIHLRLRIGGKEDHAHIGILARRLLHFGEHIVTGARGRSREHEAEVVVLLHEPVGVDHAERVVRALELADLKEERLVAGHPQPVEMRRLLAASHVPVPLGERVDGRMDHEPRHGQRGGEARVREDHGVVALGHGPEHVPELGLRRGEIMMTAPQPAAVARPALHHEERRRVVHHHEIGIEAEPLRALRAHLAQARQHGVGHHLLRSGEGPGHRVGDALEVAGADGDLPARVDAEIVEDWHEPVEHLDGEAAIAGAADIDEASSMEALAQSQEKIDGAARSDLAVVVEAGDGDGRGHRRCSSRAAVSTVRCRSRMRSRLPP